MEIRPIKSDADHDFALARIEQLMVAELDTPEGDELDVLATLVEAYEDKHFPIEAPDPVAAIRFRMDQMGLEARDLEQFIGSRARVWEVLNRKRTLSIAMIRRLHKGLNLPYENLLGS